MLSCSAISLGIRHKSGRNRVQLVHPQASISSQAVCHVHIRCFKLNRHVSCLKLQRQWNDIPDPAAGWVRALIRPRGMAEGSAAREGRVDQLTEQKVSTAARACLQVFNPAVCLLTDSKCKAME